LLIYRMLKYQNVLLRAPHAKSGTTRVRLPY
jgi:hypothetical protein